MSASGPPARGSVRAGAPVPPTVRQRQRQRLLLRWLRLPAAARVLAVYAAARLFSAFVLAEVARFQEPSAWTPADPGYADVLVLWDATWYRSIAEDGYPDAVPLGEDGEPVQSELAFYPLAPLLARLLMATGLPFAWAGSLVSLLAGAAAAVGVHALLLRALSARCSAGAARRGAWSAAVLFSVSPPSPVLQVPYTEGPALALLVAFLLLLQRQRYLPAAAVALALGLTRPVAVPLSVLVAVHLLLRALAGHRRGAVLRGREALRCAVLLGASGAAGLLWPVTAALLTGRTDAYTATMGAWRSGGDVVWLRPWWDVSRYVLGPVAGPVLLVVVVVAFAVWLLGRRTAVLGAELRTWCLAYAGYLLLVLDPFTSLFRYLVFLFPLGGLVGLHPRRRGALRVWVLASLALQVVWTAWLWRFSPPADWPP
ncbi:hypothetical protein MO973_32075 [Paenibacillus sp. TRM 82003]|uniref:hypothetical protein n=1 Tax=Kineococcus sp. TRM81007 TaxID=2925831 RepID=UPI001F5ACBAA|nr:hypothetical protein [Kineococcus sp. TRM81007]MCI2239176.1 hypothetical protein [Kineococcus sp. TRM81007]MCI3924855.1 hypothetical protein [Paenibacillus sp. TRM 82003]